MKRYLILSILFLATLSSFAQDQYSEEYTNALTLIKNKDFEKAKTTFRKLNSKYPNKTDVLHWVGVMNDMETSLDSAIYYYQKSLEFNVIGKSSMFTQLRLTRALLRSLNFEKAFEQAIVGIKNYPNDLVVIKEFKDVCKWAYYIKHHELNPNYLTNRFLQDEYTVNSIPEEYVIISNIRSRSDGLVEFSGQSTDLKYDYIKCNYRRDTSKFEVKFKKKWREKDKTNINNKYDLLPAEIFENTNEKPYIRLGAFLCSGTSDEQIDQCLETNIFEFRFCACASVTSITSEKIKKKCQNDASPEIQKMTETIRYYPKK